MQTTNHFGGGPKTTPSIHNKNKPINTLNQQLQHITTLINQDTTTNLIERADLFIKRAQILHRLNQPQLAVQDCLHVLKLNQLEYDIYAYAGMLFEEMHLWDEAFSIYTLGMRTLDIQGEIEKIEHQKENQKHDQNHHELSNQDDHHPHSPSSSTMPMHNETNATKLNPIEDLINVIQFNQGTIDLYDDNTLILPAITTSPTTMVLSTEIDQTNPPSITKTESTFSIIEAIPQSPKTKLQILHNKLRDFLAKQLISTQTYPITIPQPLIPQYNKFNAMTDWLIAHGATFPSLTIKHFTDTHRGVYSLNPIRENETICHIPQKLIVTSQIARLSDIGQLLQVFDIDLRSRHTYLALYLLHEKRKSALYHQNYSDSSTIGDHSNQSNDNINTKSIFTPPTPPTKPSFFEPYINILPESFDTIPLFFNPDDLLLLSGSFTLTKIGDRCKSLLDEYINMKESLILKLVHFFVDQIIFASKDSTNNDNNKNTSINDINDPIKDIHSPDDDVTSSPTMTNSTPVLSISSTTNQFSTPSPAHSLDDILPSNVSPNQLDIHNIPHFEIISSQKQNTPLHPPTILTDMNKLISNLLSKTQTKHSSKTSSKAQQIENINSFLRPLYYYFNLCTPPTPTNSTDPDPTYYPPHSITDVNELALFINDYVHKVIIPFTFEEFVWGRMCVITRIFGMTIGSLKTDGLVPYCDMLNHKLPRETRWNYDNVTDGFVIVSLHDRHERGIEIFDSYGRKCNNRFFINYGFALNDNVDNEAVLTVGCDLYGVDKYVLIDYSKIDVNDHNSLPSYTITKQPIKTPKHPSKAIKNDPKISLNEQNIDTISTPTISFDVIKSYTESIKTFHAIFQHQYSNSTHFGGLAQAIEYSDNLPPIRPLYTSSDTPWPHEYACETSRDRFIAQKLAILGVDLANISSSTTTSTLPQSSDQLFSSPQCVSTPKMTPSSDNNDNLTILNDPSDACTGYKTLLQKTQRSYQVPANPMDTKTLQLLSYLRFLHLSPEQILELREYQVKNNMLSQVPSPASTAIVFSAVPPLSPPQSTLPQMAQITTTTTTSTSKRLASNSNPKKAQFLNVDNVVLITLENEISMLKLLIYITHVALTHFPTTIDQDNMILKIHHTTSKKWESSRQDNDNNNNDNTTVDTSHDKPTISNQALLKYFLSSTHLDVSQLSPASFILTDNQVNSIVQCRGEKIVLTVLQEFALHTLALIHTQQLVIDREVIARKVASRSTSTLPTTLKQGQQAQTINQIKPKPTLRQLLARNDYLPGSCPNSDNNNHNNTPIDEAYSTGTEPNVMMDYKHHDGDDTGKVVADYDDDNVDNDSNNNNSAYFDDVDDENDEEIQQFIRHRHNEVLTLVSQQYPVICSTIPNRVTELSTFGFQ